MRPGGEGGVIDAVPRLRRGDAGASCSGARPHGESTVDLCDGCHALWLDANESVQLTPAATIALFREVHRGWRGSASRTACHDALSALPSHAAQTQDIRHATRFSYWRCPQGHGRLTPFVQFLREKDFIRPLAPAEIERLKAHVRTIRCSGCGAPVDLARDMVCSFCRAPIEAIDPQAVAKALQTLERAETQSPEHRHGCACRRDPGFAPSWFITGELGRGKCRGSDQYRLGPRRGGVRGLTVPGRRWSDSRPSAGR